MAIINTLSKFETVLDADQIQTRVAELGQQITQDHESMLDSAQQPLIILGALKGMFVFMADLVRQIDLPTEIYFFDVATLEEEARRNFSTTLDQSIYSAIEDRHVLLIEDIVNQGLSLSHIVRLLWQCKPKSLEVCTFLSKESNRLIDTEIKYVGFDIDADYVIGYGLDYKEKYRNLPYLVSVDPENLD